MQLDQQYRPFGERIDFFKAATRRLKFGYYCECYPPYGGRRGECNDLGNGKSILLVHDRCRQRKN